MREADGDAQTRFYEASYSEQDPRTREWRELLATYNAEPLLALCAKTSVTPRRVVDIGCGDGSLLSVLSERRLGRSYAGYEIAASAAALAAGRPIPNLRVAHFDGARLPEPDDAFDLALLVFVLEYASQPLALLREAARVAPAVALGVELGDTWRRPARGYTAGFTRFNRRSFHELLGAAGLEVRAERTTTPEPALRAYWNEGWRRPAAMAGAHARALLQLTAPGLAQRLFSTFHFAVCSRRAPAER